jgi:hypothetical protein
MPTILTQHKREDMGTVGRQLLWHKTKTQNHDASGGRAHVFSMTHHIRDFSLRFLPSIAF